MDQPSPQPEPRPKQKRRKAGFGRTPPPPIDPELSAKRRVAGLLGALASGASVKIAAPDAAASAQLRAKLLEPLPMPQNGQIVSFSQPVAKLQQAKEWAMRASPRIILRLVRFVHDSSTSRRDAIAAAKVILDVAGATAPQAEGGRDVRDMDASELRALVMVAKSREAAIEAQSDNISGTGQAETRASAGDKADALQDTAATQADDAPQPPGERADQPAGDGARDSTSPGTADTLSLAPDGADAAPAAAEPSRPADPAPPPRLHARSNPTGPRS